MIFLNLLLFKKIPIIFANIPLYLWLIASRQYRITQFFANENEKKHFNAKETL